MFLEITWCYFMVTFQVFILLIVNIIWNVFSYRMVSAKDLAIMLE